MRGYNMNAMRRSSVDGGVCTRRSDEVVGLSERVKLLVVRNGEEKERDALIDAGPAVQQLSRNAHLVQTCPSYFVSGSCLFRTRGLLDDLPVPP